MQEAQHASGKVLNIGVVNRFNTSVNMIKQYIDSGKLGDVHHVYVSFRAHRSIPGLGGAFTTKAIAGGGALIDWGVHFLDIVMYCCGDPAPRTVTGETFCKLGKDLKGYAYTDMWAGPPNYDGIYDVDDSVTGMIRTDGPVITFNGAWAQNIGEREMYIDFMGDRAGIRLQYGADFKVYTTEHGALVEYKPEFQMGDMFGEEVDAFINCIQTGEKLPAHIDTVIITAQIMQAIYDSSEKQREISFV
jgi:predicted dehydrogenase